MAEILRQSSAVTIKLGPLVSIDGIHVVTSLNLNPVVCYLHKGSAAAEQLTPTASAGDNDFVHDAGGWWTFELTAANTATLGSLKVSFTDPNTFLPMWKEFHIIPAALYDATGLVNGISVETALARILSVIVNDMEVVATDPSIVVRYKDIAGTGNVVTHTIPLATGARTQTIH